MFRRDGDRIVVELGEQERLVVALSLQVLAGVDSSPIGDPGRERLSYRAHPDDPEADERFRSLTGGMLHKARADDRRTLAGSLQADSIDRDEAEAWMRVVGEARLVLATGLGIEDDGWEQDLNPEHAPRELLLLEYLGRIQDALVRVLQMPG